VMSEVIWKKIYIYWNNSNSIFIIFYVTLVYIDDNYGIKVNFSKSGGEKKNSEKERTE